MDYPNQSQINALNKISNSEMILSIYPMIDNIVVNWLPQIETILFRIYLNDAKITSENMYVKGLDPHYLIDVHLSELLSYLGIDKSIKTSWALFGPDRELITNYL